MLIGPNDAGKTSLLEAIVAFYASADKVLPQTFPPPWGGRELVSHWQSAPTVQFSGESRIEETTTPKALLMRLAPGRRDTAFSSNLSAGQPFEHNKHRTERGGAVR